MTGTWPEPNVLRGPGSPSPVTPEPPAGAVEPPRAAPPEASPKQHARWRGWAFQIGVIAAIAIAALIFRDRLTGAATDLRVGDCFNKPADINQVSDLQHRPCSEPHDAEVIFVGDHPAASEYPGQLAFDQFAEEMCAPALESYLGRDLVTEHELTGGYLYPLEDGWHANDHEIACFVFRVDAQPLMQSVKAARN